VTENFDLTIILSVTFKEVRLQSASRTVRTHTKLKLVCLLLQKSASLLKVQSC